MPIHASLSVPATAQSTATSAADSSRRAAIAALAARHGMSLAASAEALRWLAKSDLPTSMDERAFAALSALVRHLYALSTPGGNDRGDG